MSLKRYYVFSTVQRYGYFSKPTIARLWHFIYQEYGMDIKIADRTACLSVTYVKCGCGAISFYLEQGWLLRLHN